MALGVRLGVHSDGTFGQGVLAVLIAAATILVSKMAVANLVFDDTMGELVSEFHLSDEDMVERYADQVVEEMESKGQKVHWPAARMNDEAPLDQRYPLQVVGQARQRWTRLRPDQREAERKAAEEQIGAMFREAVEGMRGRATEDIFTPWDLLWFGLAAVTAFKVGGER